MKIKPPLPDLGMVCGVYVLMCVMSVVQGQTAVDVALNKPILAKPAEDITCAR